MNGKTELSNHCSKKLLPFQVSSFQMRSRSWAIGILTPPTASHQSSFMGRCRRWALLFDFHHYPNKNPKQGTSEKAAHSYSKSNMSFSIRMSDFFFSFLLFFFLFSLFKKRKFWRELKGVDPNLKTHVNTLVHTTRAIPRCYHWWEICEEFTYFRISH